MDEKNITFMNQCKSIIQEITNGGWKQISVGRSKRVDYNEPFLLFRRTRNLIDITNQQNCQMSADILDKSAIDQSTDPNSINNFCKKTTILSGNGQITKTYLNAEIARSNITMGDPTVGFDPDLNTTDSIIGDIKISRFSEFASLQSLRSNNDSLVIGFNSEWYGTTERKVLSWHFALIYENLLYEYVFIKKDFDNSPACYNLWIELALARILDDLQSPLYRRIRISNSVKYHFIPELDPKTNQPLEGTTTSWDDAVSLAKYAYVRGKPSKILIADIVEDISRFPFTDADWSSCKRTLDKGDCSNISITLVSHFAKSNVTTLFQDGAYRKDLLPYLKEASGGLFTVNPIYLEPKSVNPKHGWDYCYPIELHIRDSLCSAPGRENSLEALGNVVGFPKVALPADDIINMDKVLLTKPVTYINYSSADAVIALLYTSAIYGINKHQSVTILSAGTMAIQQSLADYLETTSRDEFDHIYRGIMKVRAGKTRTKDQSGFIDQTNFQPVSIDARDVQNFASLAYHGGYNSCSDIGFYDNESFDYDLQSAYPTAMSLVPDVDWNNCISHTFSQGHILTLNDFKDSTGVINPYMLMFAYVRFEFPNSIKFPCILNVIDNIPIFTRTSEGIDGVFACGPELYLALKLGATITVSRGFVLRKRLLANGNVSCSLSHAVKNLVSERRNAKAICGNGSIEELVLKLVVCGAYGKIAQNVKPSAHWSAYTKRMENIGCSSITNPVSAAMITSIVRSVLLAAQNQITELGYTVYSVTTDGLISNIPKNLLASLDLYGLRAQLSAARYVLTDGVDDEIWEIKHCQRDLLNLTTRGNISLNTGKQPAVLPSTISAESAEKFYANPVYTLPGVCAHNGTKSSFTSDSYDDRLWLMTESLSRIGPVEFNVTQFTPFRDIVEGDQFRKEVVNKRVRMDFDMKRKPVRESILTLHPVINGVQYEIANLTTEPFENQEEFIRYRETVKLTSCLRTQRDWAIFFNKLACYGTSAKPRDFEFSRLMSVIRMSRLGLLSIPYLDDSKISVSDKLKLINYVNTSKKVFKKSDWENARRPDRSSSILPTAELTDLIEKIKSLSDRVSEILSDNSACCNPEAFIPIINWLKRLLRRSCACISS